MGKSIGLLELKSIPAGVQSADEMLKAADVELLVATAICPGKYIIIVSGQVGAVKSSMERGRQVAGTFLICHHIINNVHASVPSALVGTVDVEHVTALGMLETMSALTAVQAADIAAKASNITFTPERYGDIARLRVKNAQLILLKPSTYMNLSGNAVRYWRDHEKIDNDHLLVLVDDLALPFGAIRLKANGSDAGHNGLKNIAAMLGTQAYPRLRFGIGNDFQRGQQIEYVLGAFTLDQRQKLPVRIDVAIEAIKAFCLSGLDFAMCNFNNK